MEKIRIYARAERTVAHLEELEAQMGDITFDRVTVPSRTKLARHRKSGDHKITQTKGVVDHFVNLEGPAALPVEVGHHNSRTGEFTPGIHVLGSTVFEAEVSSGNH